MLASLSSDKYQCGKSKPAFLLHSTGHLPNNSEIDAAIIYADYYYIEALVRLKNLIEIKLSYRSNAIPSYCFGLRGSVNQNVEPSPNLEFTPISPPIF